MTSSRRVTVVLLLVALMSGHWALIRCAFVCDARHPGLSASVPSCHHTGSAAARIGEAPARCAQDHAIPVSVGAAGTLSGSSAPVAQDADGDVARVMIAVSFERTSDPSAGPPISIASPAFLTPLRI